MRKIFFVLSLIIFSICCFSQGRYISTTTKKIVFTRDGGMCKCCGSSHMLEYDHITPYSCGGSSDASNIQLLCRKCNRSKSNSCYCKVHNSKVGDNCCEGRTKTTKSRRSSESNTERSINTSSQCTGTTKKGTRCRKMTTNPNGRCYLH